MKNKKTSLIGIKQEKTNIGLAGEMRVCAEFLKQGYNASITYGNAKATDIILLGAGGKYLRIEVKTSFNGRNFVTGYFQKYSQTKATNPDFWVFYLPDKDRSSHGDRFFVLSHADVGRIQLTINKGVKPKSGEGVDNISIRILEETKSADNWTAIGKI